MAICVKDSHNSFDETPFFLAFIIWYFKDEFVIPVDASATTVRIDLFFKSRYDVLLQTSPNKTSSFNFANSGANSFNVSLPAVWITFSYFFCIICSWKIYYNWICIIINIFINSAYITRNIIIFRFFIIIRNSIILIIVWTTN